MNITHDMSNDLTEYDPESRQVDGPNPIENRISSSAARVPDIISCTSGITVQGRHRYAAGPECVLASWRPLCEQCFSAV